MKNPYESNADTEQFFRYAAYAEGMEYHDWCLKYGIVDEATEHQIKRHERPVGNSGIRE